MCGWQSHERLQWYLLEGCSKGGPFSICGMGYSKGDPFDMCGRGAVTKLFLSNIINHGER